MRASRQLLVRSFLVVVAAFTSTLAATAAQESIVGTGQRAAPNTWSAKSSTGLTLAGTWTAEIDRTSGAVTGTWTLDDARGRTVRRGGWSAVKSPSGWSGTWRAVAPGAAEYSGSWSASVGLPRESSFADLFAAAATAAMSGTWRAGRQSGSWSIRVYD